MPDVSRGYIKASLIYLVLGVILGMLIQINKAFPFQPQLWSLKYLHSQWMMLGWFAQLAMGVAYWCLPRHTGGGRGSLWVTWLSFSAYNAGIVSFSISQLSFAYNGPIPSQVAVLGSGYLFVGVVLYIFNMWPRLKALRLSSNLQALRSQTHVRMVE